MHIPLFYFSTLCAFTLCLAEEDSVVLDAHEQTALSDGIPKLDLRVLNGEQSEVIASEEESNREAHSANAENEIPRGSRPMRVGLRYTTPDGIGYKQGYTTIEGFFSHLSEGEKWLGFLDLRGHVLDNGKLASNAGVGVRYLSSSRIWGVNAYYDYRNTEHQHYNQMAAGLEVLGRVWDFRLNGYLPVGDKVSDFRHTHFHTFEGHNIILRSTRDFALKGGNFEVGVHIDRYDPFRLYVAGGPYYLTGEGASTWGGELRGALDILHDVVRLEGNVSYDHFFHWIGQGQISINIPLGKKRKMRCRTSCAKQKTLEARSMQRVDRLEILPVGKEKKNTKAIDPVTGEPYFVVFVDNLSSSLGTFESPYPSLALAQANSGPNNILYIFPGDGTSRNLDTGIALQPGQMLLGASTVHPIATTLGTVSIPPFASTLPVLTNAAAMVPTPVVTLANDNVVSGLYIGNLNGAGITGIGINNFTATQNAIVGGFDEGIFLNNVTGQMTVDNNFFSQFNNADVALEINCLHIAQSSAQCAASVSSNAFYCFTLSSAGATSGLFADLSATGSIDTLNVANNTFYGNAVLGVHGILISSLNSSFVNNVSISHCSVDNFVFGLEVNIAGSGSINNLTLANTNIVKNNSNIVLNLSSSGSISNIDIANCIVNNGSTQGLHLTVSGSGSIGNFQMRDSNFDSNSFGISTLLSGTGSISNFVATNSSFSNCSGGGISLTLANPGSIQNMQWTNCHFDRNLSGSGFLASLSGSGSIANIAFSNCTANGNSSTGINMAQSGAGSFNNITISNSDLSNNNVGLFVDVASGSIQNISVLNSNINANLNGVEAIDSGTIDQLVISGCNLIGNRNEGVFLENGTISELQIVHSVFDGNILGIALDLTGAITRGTIASNLFDGNAGPALQVIIPNPSSNILSIANNTLLNSAHNFDGYAMTISTNDPLANLCLDFVNNLAAPVNLGPSVFPYFFDNAGTFQLTAESTQANNVGSIRTVGVVGPAGTCSQ